MHERKSYAQQAIDRWLSNPNHHQPTVLGQTVKMIFEKLLSETPTGDDITPKEAAATILKGLSSGTTKQEVILKNKLKKIKGC